MSNFVNQKHLREVLIFCFNWKKSMAEAHQMLEVYGDTVRVYFAMCLFTEDNLGANSILGYVESFSANYCRICKEHKTIMQKQYQIHFKSIKARNIINYNTDLIIDDSTHT